MRGGSGASRRRHGHKNRAASPNNKRRSPWFAQTPKTASSSSISSNISRNGRITRDGGGGGGGIGQGRDGRGSRNPGTVTPGGVGRHDADGGSSGGPSRERGAKFTPVGTGNGMKGGGGGRGGGSGAAAAARKATCTPPRKQRPRPPDSKDSTRWVVAGKRGLWLGGTTHLSGGSGIPIAKRGSCTSLQSRCRAPTF